MTSKVQIFVCECCHETFESDRPDEEANEEAFQLFGTVNACANAGPGKENAVVCDTCWEKISLWYAER